MSFQTSEYSFLTQEDYGAAETRHVEINDFEGSLFRIYSDDVVELARGVGLSSGLEGKTWSPGSGNYNEVVANLQAVPGNRAKMEEVMSPQLISDAVEKGGAPSEGGAPSAIPQRKPLPQRWWFWPTVILGTAGVVGGATYYFRATDQGKEQWARLTGKLPNRLSLS